ncbi:Ca(2+)-dependent cysteine protease [Entomortierella beljakovae]|nr:Ca(2+)-dependent cysteine protease [Entomortierella beljakovae]
MSQQQVGEPVVNVETVVTVLPDGRKVTKTIKKITKSYQVQVPAGAPVPEGAHLISSVEVPINGDSMTYQEGSFPTQQFTEFNAGDIKTEPSVVVQSTIDEDGRKVTKTTTTHSSSTSSGYAPHGGNFLNVEPTVTVQSTVDDDGRKVTKTTTTHTSSSSSGNVPQVTNVVNTEPTVVVQSTVDENGRKVTKTTSSSGGPFSKLFKRFSINGKSKPLPTIPAVKAEPPKKVHQVAPVPVPQKKHESKPLPKPLPVVDVDPEINKVHLETLEAQMGNGAKLAESDCSGERRAVLIGINYFGHDNPLQGCANDTKIMKKFLLEQGFPEENIRVLTDDQAGTELSPTKANIIRNLKWLIHDAQKNDSFFLHYSGHGGQVRDLDGDETEGKDNCIFPLDHKENGIILDDELHRLLVEELPEAARLTCVFDCCHSGSALDLPYIYTETGYILGSNALANLGYKMVEVGFDADALKELQAQYEKLKEGEKEFARQVKLKAAKAEVILFSGCKDDQTSADVSITRAGNTSSNGAMTHAFTKSIRENPNQTFQEMLASIRRTLEEKYKQKPQLSASRPVNMGKTFHM